MVDLDMVVMDITVDYDAATETSMSRVANEPKKVYSGLFMLAE